ncbi:membrane protein [Acinetobacter apis]|uniref:Uncharacterized membrane protein n=1 Tax=Acinetobacter apis TaxID=1229165 RepID=A0A217EGV7_9GAMM|nr:hypothetical protein [Acinetobacter apis]SNQ29725.1 Uncharacterized membrane protein [Acinetobacter apis]
MTDSQFKSDKTLTFILYILYIAAIFSAGILALIALIINYAKRDSVQGTIFESHFNWQISTVWWYLLWNILGGIPLVVSLFMASNMNYSENTALSLTSLTLMLWITIILVSWVWIIYRAVKGLIVLNENRAI